MRSQAPYKDGDLSKNIKVDDTPTGFTIYVDGETLESETGTDYMPYTNELWVSPRWRGRQNPNLKWFDVAVFELAHGIASQLNAQAVRRD